MREIKFRALSMCKGEQWIYGDIIHYARNPHTEKWVIHDTTNGCETDIEENTIGQYIGLKDKNDKEIYEGDILRVKEFENLLMKEFIDDDNKYSLFTLEDAKGELRNEYVTPVIWNEGCFDLSSNGLYFDMFVSCIFGDMKRSSPLFEFEIIGNIYENADLIPHKLLAYINK